MIHLLFYHCQSALLVLATHESKLTGSNRRYCCMMWVKRVPVKWEEALRYISMWYPMPGHWMLMENVNFGKWGVLRTQVTSLINTTFLSWCNPSREPCLVAEGAANETSTQRAFHLCMLAVYIKLERNPVQLKYLEIKWKQLGYFFLAKMS